MNTRIVLVDDETLALQEMELLLKDYPDMEICGKAKDAPEAISVINHLKPDLIFLDIQLKEINSFSILEQLKTQPHIIFVTAYNQYATRAFEINALDYLMKPVHPDRLQESIQRYKNQAPLHQPNLKIFAYTDRMLITEKNEYKLITISEIQFIQSDGDYTQVHLLDGKKKLILKTMNEWENLLPAEHFMRIHRSTLINLEHIDRIEKSFNNTCKVTLKGASETLQMSQRYTAKFLTRYKA